MRPRRRTWPHGGATPQAKRYSASAAKAISSEGWNSLNASPTIDIYRGASGKWCGAAFGVLVMLMQPFVRRPPLFLRFLRWSGHDWRNGCNPWPRQNACGAGLRRAGAVRFFSFSSAASCTVAFLVAPAQRAIPRTERLPFAGILRAAVFATAGMAVLASGRRSLLNGIHRFGDEFDLQLNPRGNKAGAIR